MAIRLQHSVSLPWQTSLFPTSLLLGHRKSCSSSPSKPYSPRRVHCVAGPREPEVQAVKIPVKVDEMKLPPLLASLAIPGLPPCQESKYGDEALECILKRWPYKWLEPDFRSINSLASFMYPSAVSCDRLTAISSICTLQTFLDDVFFDLQVDDDLLKEIGVDQKILASPQSIKAYLHSLTDLLQQEEPLQNPTQIQAMTWKLGFDLRELSNPEWLELFSEAIVDFHNSSLESYAADLESDHTYIRDLESFTRMRIRDAGGRLLALSIEFCNHLFLPAEVHEHPVVRQLTVDACKYFAYVNDIFSYSKEQDEPHNSRNLIKVFMESEGILLPQAAWRAINLTNSIVEDFMKLEKQLPAWEGESMAFAVHRYVEGLKELMSGALYWHSLQKRYRHPKAPFPELRDVNASFSPTAKDFQGV